MMDDVSFPHMIRIAYLIGQLTVGGTETQLLQLVRHLDRKKYKVMVISLSGNAPLAASFRETGCEVQILERERYGRLLTLWNLYGLLKSFNPGILHSFAYASRAAIPIAHTLSGVKTIVSLRTDPARHVRWVDRLINSFADLILSNSQLADREIKRLWPHIRAGIVYNGIDLDAFDLSSQRSLDTLWIPENDVRICIVARQVPVKRLDVLLEAFALVCVTAPDVQLWLVGDGPLRPILEEHVRKLALTRKVFFWGEQSDVASILAQCQIGVLSSSMEGLSNAIIEYMAARLPVVATRVGGNPEVIIPFETGLIVPPQAPQALADALIYLLHHPDTAHRMGLAGRKRVETHFTVERMVGATEDLYLELLQEKNGC